MTNITSETIKTTARKYIGTPFHPQGRVKGVGVDCVGLIICIGKDLKIFSTLGKPLHEYDTAIYNVHQPNAILMLQELDKHLISSHKDIEAGDILCFLNERDYAHIGIATEEERYIHSCMIRGEVLEEKIPKSPCKVWKFPS